MNKPAGHRQLNRPRAQQPMPKTIHRIAHHIRGGSHSRNRNIAAAQYHRQHPPWNKPRLAFSRGLVFTLHRRTGNRIETKGLKNRLDRPDSTRRRRDSQRQGCSPNRKCLLKVVKITLLGYFRINKVFWLGCQGRNRTRCRGRFYLEHVLNRPDKIKRLNRILPPGGQCAGQPTLQIDRRAAAPLHGTDIFKSFIRPHNKDEIRPGLRIADNA